MMYKPNPFDTTKIELSEDIKQLTELLAQNTHEVWAAKRMSEGWTYGSVRDDRKMQHPGLIPYDNLSEVEKEYDRNTAMETLKVIKAMGYQITKAEE
ncbi:MAG: ryanodine receptor [Herbinix sp.]|jgi:hypothetical protein|nr:ryanodine receptor [Herbinix sp.]